MDLAFEGQINWVGGIKQLPNNRWDGKEVVAVQAAAPTTHHNSKALFDCVPDTIKGDT